MPTHTAAGPSGAHHRRVAVVSPNEDCGGAWRRAYIPWLLRPGGPAIFFRLMHAPEGQPLPISELYRGAGASSLLPNLALLPAKPQA